MSTGLIYDQRFLEHDTGPSHPERPARLRAVVDRFQQDRLWDRFHHLSFEPLSKDALHELHTPEYVQRCFETCARGESFIDSPDSAICPDSAAIAQYAAGGVVRAAQAVAQGELHNALCLVRPPGHHAEAGRSMGFCLFNHIALAAQWLTQHHGYKRVAIVDFDVHHGNGTQHLFEQRDDVLFISVHQDPATLFPGTGFDRERGKGKGEGYTLNIPLPGGSDDTAYMEAMEQTVGPALEAYSPDCLLVSAGFDAADADPLAQMRVTADGFQRISRFLTDHAHRLCGGRLISTLEGGYDLDALSEGAALHARALLDEADQHTPAEASD